MCVKTVNPRCGDGSIDVGEGCDDANITSGDGCSSTCQREPGWKCPTPGMKPARRTPTAATATWTWASSATTATTSPPTAAPAPAPWNPSTSAPTPGMPCKSTIVCGDGKITGDEACDDVNSMANDGCSADCKQVEPGYTCPPSGGKCTKTFVPVCGDGMLSFGEVCDDGNAINGDGCSADCKTVQQGWRCPVVGMKCSLIAVCGDGILSPGEQCDDGTATAAQDGCPSNCILQPRLHLSRPRPALSVHHRLR
jgi:cysteine-rich repeat protein